MKNIEVFTTLDKISKIENLKLGGVKLKIVLKNKKSLIKSAEDLNEVKKKLIEQYTEEGVLNTELANKEWQEVLSGDSDVILEKVFSTAELDQFSDLTLEQYEILELMSE
jgi:hypothetical protein